MSDGLLGVLLIIVIGLWCEYPIWGPMIRRKRMLKWTKKRPSKQGWYWCKVRYEQPHVVFVVEMLDGNFNVCYGDQAIAIEWYKKYREKFWAGPIPEPDEKEM